MLSDSDCCRIIKCVFHLVSSYLDVVLYLWNYKWTAIIIFEPKIIIKG